MKDLSIIYYAECDCHSDEHTIRFNLQDFGDDADLYMSVFLGSYYPSFWKRVWYAFRYIFGYKCQYGHWDCTQINSKTAGEIIELLQDYRNRAEGYKNKNFPN